MPRKVSADRLPSATLRVNTETLGEGGEGGGLITNIAISPTTPSITRQFVQIK